ncbi:MAG: pyrroline-5-carboxylate reductase [Anaerolineaceae bacterium]|jgi:pyrroline-5-carboxylate reductase|nr:pyrroline-5-carboxylate reductase [Anaerolineaceae bacterium]
MVEKNITFVGGGNMAHSLIGGLINAGTSPGNLTVGEPQSALRDRLADRFGVTVFSDNTSAIKDADVVILAVKPQVMRDALRPLAQTLTENTPLLISIAAGINVASLESWAGGNHAVVRVMPNTPALVSAGISALFANDRVTPAQKNLGESIMRAVGTAVWIGEESLMDTVTAVSGSGPAYFFYLMEALEQAAVEEGLDPKTARLLTLETAFGAARLALESSETPAMLRQRVTSPGGTTEAAIRVLDKTCTNDAVNRAVSAARKRSYELATALESD